MKQIAFSLILLLFGIVALQAQNVMRIALSDGKLMEIPVAQIDSVSFVTVEEEAAPTVSLVGTWYWENQLWGYSETVNFNADGSFTCVDHFFEYGFDTSTYGTYYLFGSILNIHSNGYGYNRFYQWMVMELTESKLTVMTPEGSFTYTRLNK